MIGYYVHHVGHGHLQRATTLATALTDSLGEEVVGLSSLPAPPGWQGDWVRLARDDDDAAPADPTAGDALHWAPRHSAGLRGRMSGLSGWLERARPRLVVVDVSVEVATLVRLHGVPVVAVVVPGDRSDPAHRWGHRLSSALVGFWPPDVPEMVVGLEPETARRLHCLGALSRVPIGTSGPGRHGQERRVVVLGGSGGADPGWPAALASARAQTPPWRWSVLGGAGLGPDATWVADPWRALAEADVVVTHAGESAVAEVAAARRPAVLVPQSRPHREQQVVGRALDTGRWPVIVEHDGVPSQGWDARLAAAAGLDGTDWAGWCDGKAEQRFADLVDDLLRRTPGPG